MMRLCTWYYVGIPLVLAATSLAQGTQSPSASQHGNLPDPDLVPDRPTNPWDFSAPAQRSSSQGIVFVADGRDTFSTPGMFSVTNNTAALVTEVRWDIGDVPDAFWDLDGSANFGESLTPIIDSTVGMSAADITWGGLPAMDTHPTTLIATIDPPMGPGAFFSFGVDTDFYKSDPCPGSNFGTVPPCVVTGSAVGSPDFTCEFVPDGFNRSEAVCELGGLVVIIDFETEDDFVTALVNGQDITRTGEFGTLVEIDGVSATGLFAAIFDSTPGGPNDPSQDLDLLVDLGNVLIVQEDPNQSIPGIYDSPNDDAAGGDIFVNFLGSGVTPLSVDLIDLCPDSGQEAVVTLIDAAGSSATYMVPSGWTEDIAEDGPPGFRTLDLTTLDNQPGFVATATASADAGFDASAVVAIVVHFNGSAALDNITFAVNRQMSVIDLEDLGIPPGDQICPPDLVGIESGGYLFEPTMNSLFLDMHAGNAIPSWMYNGTTVVTGHDELLMRRPDGGAFSLLGFDFAGWPVDFEIPFSIVANTGAVANFTPDGLVDGLGGAIDFESFAMPPGFEVITSALFIHTGDGTNVGIFGLDNLMVSSLGIEPNTRPVVPPPSGIHNPHDPMD